MVSYGKESPNENYVLYTTDSFVAFYIGRPGGSSSSAQATWNLALAADTTYHLVGSYDGSTIALYANGVLVATKAASGAVAGYDGVTGLAIGSIYDGYYATTGTIDEVAIYASALTANRVSAHYLAGK